MLLYSPGFIDEKTLFLICAQIFLGNHFYNFKIVRFNFTNDLSNKTINIKQPSVAVIILKVANIVVTIAVITLKIAIIS